MNWETLTEEELTKHLGSHLQTGLTDEEALTRLKQEGPNEFVFKPRATPFQIILRQFQSPLVYLLILAAIFSLVLVKPIDAFVILVIVALNATIGFFQEWKAEKALESLKKLIREDSPVIRSGEKKIIPSSEIVRGDLVVLREGERVPADLRMVGKGILLVNQAPLTGESEPIEKTSSSCEQPIEAIAARHNLLYQGTFIVAGEGMGLVVASGNKTEFAKIAKEVAEVETPTPLGEKMKTLGRQILIGVLGLGLVIFFLALKEGKTFLESFLILTALVVAAIPEGLPAILTIILALGVHQMAKRKALVRRLLAVETLGSSEVILVDKTGTLTLNQMFLKKVVLPGNQTFIFEGKGYEPKGSVSKETGDCLSPEEKKTLEETLSTALRASNGFILKTKDGWASEGDPTESAIATAALKLNQNFWKLKDHSHRLTQIPFEPGKRMMASLDKIGGREILSVKGSVETILHHSDHLLVSGRKFKMTPDHKKAIESDFHHLAHRGLRVLGVGYLEEKKFSLPLELRQICWLGLLAFEDPLRKEAVPALKEAENLGLKVKILTGDHPATALSIGRLLGIEGPENKLMEGKDLIRVSPEKLAKEVESKAIFARVTPHMKLQIVQAFEALGYTVAVTGDGINDAPALKKADIGIALGRAGTEVAKESADLVLLNDNFTTIISAIREGRTIFRNIRRVVFYFLATNLAEILIILTTLLLKFPLPFSPIQILWINLVTDGTAGIALAFEKPHHLEKDTPLSFRALFGKFLWRKIFLVALVMTVGVVFIYWLSLKNLPLELARSSAFISLIFFSVLNVFNARSLQKSLFQIYPFSNPYIWGSVILSLVLSLLTIYFFPFQKIFGTASLPFIYLLQIFSIALIIIAVMEIDKLLTKSSKSQAPPLRQDYEGQANNK